MFYPIFRIQIEVINNTLGEDWWVNKRFQLKESIIDKNKLYAQIQDKKNKEKLKHERMQTDALVKKKMGIYFCLLPWKREEERFKLSQIAALCDQMVIES